LKVLTEKAGTDIEKKKNYENCSEPSNTFIKEESREADRRCKSKVT